MLKKLTTLLIIASSFLTMLNAAEKYAVLITGDYAAKDIPEEALWQTNSTDKSLPMQEFWNDTYLMWEMLIERGYKDENIHVLFADGQDFYIDNVWVDGRYRPVHAGFSDTYTITKGDASAATITNVENVALELQGKLTEDDFLFVWTFDHGSYYSSSGSELCLLDGDMTDRHFADYFNPIIANKKVYWMQQCFSGGFADDLQADNTFFVSAVGMWPATRADDLTNTYAEIPGRENEWINGNQYMHGEFNFHMYSATTGLSPAGNEIYYSDYNDIIFSDADSNEDGIVTVSEASIWEKYYESEEDAPVKRDTGNIGYHTTLKYPTILIDGLWEYAYDFYLNTELKGIVGVPGQIWLWSTPVVEIQPNSTLLIDEVGILRNFNEEGFIVNENTKIIGLGSDKRDIITSVATSTFNDCIFENINLVADTFDDLPENYGIIELSGNNIFSNSNIHVEGYSQLVLENDATLNLTSDLTLNMDQLSILKMRDGSTLNVQDIPNYSMTPNTKINVYGNAIINGDFSTSEYCLIDIGINSTLRIQNSNFTLNELSKIKLEQGAELIVDEGSVCNFPAGSDIAVGVGSKITVNGTLNSNGTIDHISNIADDEDAKGTTWQGIKAGVGSVINLTYTNVSNAETALSGTPVNCNIMYSTFTECDNGVELINCNDYNIFNNTLIGIGAGNGVSLTSSYGYIMDNSIQDYVNGIEIILGLPLIKGNTIQNNFEYGLHITGYNAYPQLITNSPVGKNNDIINNGLGQIFLKYSASAYLENGRNNIYSDIIDGFPVVPCIVGESHLVSKVELPNRVDIPATNNYWGNFRVNEDFFNLYERYRIFYDPYATEEFTNEVQNPIPGNQISFDERMLSQAVKFEIDGKLDQAIKKLEVVIDKNADLVDSLQSQEYILALAKLPSLYAKQEMELEPLVKIYDSKIDSDDETINKKFYKEMKVTTKIKAKKYDEAIALAEEMKSEATSEGEIILAEIDIAIANMMKDAESKNRSKTDHSATISDLLVKLNGEEETSEKTDIISTALPSEFTLYQNYPNPFNPTTEISYALSQDANVSIKVYSSNGSAVAELVNASQSVGQHSVKFDASKLSNGIFYYSLFANGRVVSTKKMLLLK
ncbi:MAG: T9SS type A sorting domain-containing protein [Candidatus Delongbacteria bacterium]|nr:T9SS type A sorting domain-containing protein [Candidatus Delongbacteria bacterium]